MKLASDDRRIRERDELNAKFRRAPTDNFFPARDEPLGDRFTTFTGYTQTGWSSSPAEAIAHVMQPEWVTDVESDPLEYDSYPEQWRPFLDIPSESGGLAALNNGADLFSANNDTLRARVQEIVSKPV